MNIKAQGGTQSIQRAVSVLRTVSLYDKKGAPLSKIARKVDLHVATVRRILMVLYAEGLLDYDSVTKLYHIGHGLFSLTYSLKDYTLRENCRPAIERISQKTGDTAFLTVRSENDTLCIDQSEGSSKIRIVYDIGMRIPLGVGASGQAILSVLPSDEVNVILKDTAKRYAKHYNLTVEKVKSLVEFAHKFGFAFNEGNHQKGISAVGVPLLKNGVPIGAITVTSVSDRIDLKRAKVISTIIKKEIAHTPGIDNTGGISH